MKKYFGKFDLNIRKSKYLRSAFVHILLVLQLCCTQRLSAFDRALKGCNKFLGFYFISDVIKKRLKLIKSPQDVEMEQVPRWKLKSSSFLSFLRFLGWKCWNFLFFVLPYLFPSFFKLFSTFPITRDKKDDATSGREGGFVVMVPFLWRQRKLKLV